MVFNNKEDAFFSVTVHFYFKRSLVDAFKLPDLRFMIGLTAGVSGLPLVYASSYQMHQPASLYDISHCDDGPALTLEGKVLQKYLNSIIAPIIEKYEEEKANKNFEFQAIVYPKSLLNLTSFEAVAQEEEEEDAPAPRRAGRGRRGSKGTSVSAAKENVASASGERYK
jgi:hypothetical protein